MQERADRLHSGMYLEGVRAGLGSVERNVCFSRKRTFNSSEILDSDRPLTAYSVEKLLLIIHR
jgi:hypothetical protein